MFVCFDSLRPCQQFFSHIETDLPGLSQLDMTVKQRNISSNELLTTSAKHSG